LNFHHLDGWASEVTDPKVSNGDWLGLCCYWDKKIFYSIELCGELRFKGYTNKEIFDTVAHEVAHALTYKEIEAHGPLFQSTKEKLFLDVLDLYYVGVKNAE
jgi:hypothetical protein